MAQKQAWMSKVKSEFEESPLASNVIFGLILLCLEKLVEVEFACPCNPTFNIPFVAFFFIVPAVLVVLLMINIRGRKNVENVFSGAVPAIVWWILLFFDGQYFACAMTFWSGRFVILDKAAPQKWCEPANRTSTQEFMIRTQKWFSWSQVIGMVIIGLFTLLLGIYLIYCKCFKDKEHVQGEDPIPLEEMC